MADNIPMYFLVQDGSVVFGPRRYYKPAFVRFAEVNELQTEFPDTVSELVNNIGDKLVLVEESKLDECIYTVNTVVENSTPAADSEADLATSIADALVDIDTTPKTTTRKKK